jgi:hypothetical protein
MILNPPLSAINSEQMEKILFSANLHHPFAYPLGIKMIPSSRPDADVMICFHGMGGSHSIIEILKSYAVIPDHLVSFNFPDYLFYESSFNSAKTTFGTIQELLPALYVIKTCIIEGPLKSINLYGFSAGGGAIINILAILNQSRYQKELEMIGINEEIKTKILQAIQQGFIILNCPLKSIEEIIEYKGSSPNLDLLAKRYRANQLRPIDSLKGIKGLKLNILLHFQVPDEVLSNHDDKLFIQQLLENHVGNMCVVFGSDGGHNAYHASLWKIYPDFLSKKCRNQVIHLTKNPPPLDTLLGE